MGLGKKAVAAYELYRTVKNVARYGNLIVDAIDEQTRPGALMKLGIRGLLDIGGKVIGVSLTSHPYFTFHRAHLEALAMALNASSNFDAAAKALNTAIRAADATDALNKTLADYRFRKNGQKLAYSFNIKGSLELLADSGPEAEKQLKEAGQTRESLRVTTDQNIYEWRAAFCELFFDSVQLLAMAEVELQTVRGAMKAFDENTKALKSGGGIGAVFAYKAIENRQWQEFDRMTKPGVGDAKAVEDPTGYAKDRVDEIARVSSDLATGCDAAMSDDAYNPSRMMLRIGSL